MSDVKDLVIISQDDVTAVRERSRMLKQFIKDELKDGTDYGMIPGCKKESLFKPGAEKLAKLFRLGSKIVNKTEVLDHEKKFFMASYTIQIFKLDTGQVISECEGSVNSQEIKYVKQNVYNIINTIQKMAQKRAYVGAIVSAVGASEFYTQDVEDTVIDYHHEKIVKANKEIEVEDPFKRNDNLGKGDNIQYLHKTTSTIHSGPVTGLFPWEVKGEISHDDITSPSEYTIPIGKLKGRLLSSVDNSELETYMLDIKLKLKREDFPENLKETSQEIIFKIEEYLHDSQHTANNKS